MLGHFERCGRDEFDPDLCVEEQCGLETPSEAEQMGSTQKRSTQTLLIDGGFKEKV